MDESQVTVGPAGRTIYRCVVGHEIAEAELHQATLIESIDGGAAVRLCREHGAPIAMRVGPADERNDE